MGIVKNYFIDFFIQKDNKNPIHFNKHIQQNLVCAILLLDLKFEFSKNTVKYFYLEFKQLL